MTFGIQVDTLSSMDATPRDLHTDETADGKKPFDDWLYGLKDKVTQARIATRLNRVALGNLGDAKSVGDGVSELRLTFGSGYRIYYALDGDKIVLLLCGGDKGSQNKDIQSANFIGRITRGEVMAAKNNQRSVSYREGLVARLKDDPEFQTEYLRSSLEDNSDMPEAILMALRDIAEARGFEELAEAAHLSKKSLYKILSETKDAKPRFETIVKLLDALGLRLTVEEKPVAS